MHAGFGIQSACSTEWTVRKVLAARRKMTMAIEAALQPDGARSTAAERCEDALPQKLVHPISIDQVQPASIPGCQ